MDPFGFAKKRCTKNKIKSIQDKVKKSKNELRKVERKLGIKVAKSAARKAFSTVAVLVDGPLPIGDVVAVGTMLYDVWDMWGSGDALDEAKEELKEALGQAKDCDDREKAAKEREDTKVKEEKNKEKLKCGEGGSYKSLKKKAAAVVGMERDHVPSSAALKKRALDLNDGEKLTSSQLFAVAAMGHAISIPKEVHAKNSVTFKGRNTKAQIGKDANNLKAAARRDLRAIKKPSYKE